MNNAAKQAAYFLNNRPLCFLSTVFGVRDILVGLALALPSEWHKTVLYSNLDQLGGAAVYGWLLTLVALFASITAVREHTRWTQFGLRVQSWFWLFAVMSYALTGHYIFAVTDLFMCCIPAGYVAFYYKWTPIWEEPKRTWRENHGMKAHV